MPAPVVKGEILQFSLLAVLGTVHDTTLHKKAYDEAERVIPLL